MRYMYIIPAINGVPTVKINDELTKIITMWKTTGDKIIFYSDELIDELLHYKDIEVIDTLNNEPVPHIEESSISSSLAIKDIEKEVTGSVSNTLTIKIPRIVTVIPSIGGLMKFSVYISYSSKPDGIEITSGQFGSLYGTNDIGEKETQIPEIVSPILPVPPYISETSPSIGVKLGVPAKTTIDYYIKLTGKLLTFE